MAGYQPTDRKDPVLDAAPKSKEAEAKPDTYACSPLAPTIHSPRRQTPGRRRTPPGIPSRSPATSSTRFPSATEPVPDIRLSAYTTGAHPGETASVTVPEFVTNGSRVRNDHHESHRCDPPANNGRGDRDPRARPSPRSHPQIAKNTTPHLCTGPSPTTTHPGLGARPARPTGADRHREFVIPRAVE